MTTDQKRAKILSAAATIGAHADLYWDVATQLRAEGLIEMRETFTRVGARVQRWFLVA